MHPEALEAVRRMVNTSGYINAPKPKDSYVGSGTLDHLGLDIGGADVNGSARSIIPDVTRWYGLDVAEGEGVDLIADASDAVQMSAYCAMFDVVLCTEVLEHVENWRGVVNNAWDVLAPGGFAFFTFAATDNRTFGRRPHGARGEHDVPEGEHYANVIISEFIPHLMRITDVPRAALAGTDRAEVRVNPNPGDVYAWFRK